MSEQLLSVYNSLTLQEQKEVYDFAIFLASKDANSTKAKNAKKDSTKAFGALQKYANPALIQKEESAWQEAVKEKYRG